MLLVTSDSFEVFESCDGVGDNVEVVEEAEDIFHGEAGLILNGSTGTGMLLTASKEFTEGTGGFIGGELFNLIAGLIWGSNRIGRL